jgi:hypothetical protein
MTREELQNYLNGEDFTGTDWHKAWINESNVFLGLTGGGVGNASVAAVASAGETSGKLGYDDWLSSYGTDTDKMYNEGAAALNYELQTWAAGYGARAEQLFQMGLSNSGVSDIYGANAYSAYVSAMNDLYLAKIQKDEENRLNYKAYSDEYEAAQAAKTEASNNRISAAFTTYMSSYTPATAEAIRTSLIAQGLSESEAASALAQLETYYNNLPEDQRTDVVAKNAKINEAFIWMSEQYNAGVDLDTLEAQAAAVYGVEVAEAARENFASFATNTGTSQRVLDAYNSIISSESGYDSSMKENLSNLYANNGWTQEEIDELIEMLERTEKIEKESAANATVSEVGNVVVGTESVATLQAKLADAARIYGVDSKEYKDIQGAVSSKIRETIEWALEVNPDGTPKRLTDTLVAEVLGLDSSAWSEENEKNQLSAIENALMEKARSLESTGGLKHDDFVDLVQKQVTSEISKFKEDEDKDIKASGLRNVGGVVQVLLEYKNKGNLTEEDYNNMISNIINQMNLNIDINRNKLTWEGINDTADATIQYGAGTLVDDGTSEKLYKAFPDVPKGDYKNPWSDKSKIVLYKGKLYKYDSYDGITGWFNVTPDTIGVIGDWVWNTKDQKNGVYEIVLALLAKKTTIEGGR